MSNRLHSAEPSEAREWLAHNPDWRFSGEVNTISHEGLVELVDELYRAGCEEIVITDYESEIDIPDDNAQPDMLIIKLPKDTNQRLKIFNIINNHAFGTAKRIYEDSGSGSVWYSFEPTPQTIKVGHKQITWYS